jgi:hypothetical protein
MQVRGRRPRVSGVADVPENVAGVDVLAIADGPVIEMGIVKRQSLRAVVQPDHTAADFRFPHRTHGGFGCSKDGRAARREDIHAVMVAKSAIACVAEQALNVSFACVFHREPE